MESFKKKFLWPPRSFNTASGRRWRYSDPCSLITVLGPHSAPLISDALALARFCSGFIFIRIRRNLGVPAVDYLMPSPSSFIRAWDWQCKINLHRRSYTKDRTITKTFYIELLIDPQQAKIYHNVVSDLLYKYIVLCYTNEFFLKRTR